MTSLLSQRVRDALLPARRLLSRAVLVYEERHFRELAVGALYGALAAEAGRLRDEVRALEERVIMRVDIVLEELWRRTEGVGARQATELQRLAARVAELEAQGSAQAPELERLARQMAEVHRLAGEVGALRAGGQMVVSLNGQGDLEPLLAGVASQLAPGATAVIHYAGAASRESLASGISGAGLEIVEWLTPSPEQPPLAGVTTELSDPAILRIATAINGLVAQLNDTLHAPREPGVVVRLA
ncbi:MAG TPA: hypothetical protein VFW71_03440 [Actinomycetota bacterium]|nr:hypothetical protein [Actinomycetota bacterium]